MIDIQTLSPGDFEPARIKTHQMQDGGMDISYIVSVFDCMEADFIGGTMHGATLDTAPRHHYGEAIDMVIPAIRALSARRSPKLGSKNNESFIEKAPAF